MAMMDESVGNEATNEGEDDDDDIVNVELTPEHLKKDAVDDIVNEVTSSNKEDAVIEPEKNDNDEKNASNNNDSTISDESDDDDILIIEIPPPDSPCSQVSMSEAADEERDEVGSLTHSFQQSYRHQSDWDTFLSRSFNRSYEQQKDERLLSGAFSHKSHLSEVSKMSEQELLDSIDIDTVLVETTEYVTEEVDPETSNVTVVTHTTFTEVSYCRKPSERNIII